MVINKKNHLPGWFFRFQCKRLRRNRKDLKRILSHPSPPKGKPAPLHDTISLKKIIEPIDFNNKKNRYNHDPQSPNLGNKINDL